MRIGLLGGTFNPLHNGHLHIAEEVLGYCGLDQLWFIPACQPPHKDLAGEVSFTHRLAMVEAALGEREHMWACAIEGQRGGSSYTVETLRQLRRKHPEHEYFFIMGLDSFQEVGSWREYESIFALAHVVVTARPGFEGSLNELLPVAIKDRFCYDSDAEKLLCDSGFSVIAVAHTSRDISSTQVREKILAKQSFKGMVPPAVFDYIERFQLYR